MSSFGPCRSSKDAAGNPASQAEEDPAAARQCHSLPACNAVAAPFPRAPPCLSGAMATPCAHGRSVGRRRICARLRMGAGLARGVRGRVGARGRGAPLLPLDPGRGDGRRRAQSRGRPGAGPLAAGALDGSVRRAGVDVPREAVRAWPVARARRAVRRLSVDVAAHGAGRRPRARPHPNRHPARLCRGGRLKNRRRAHGDRRRRAPTACRGRKFRSASG